MYRSATIDNHLAPKLLESQLETRPSSMVGLIQLQVPILQRPSVENGGEKDSDSKQQNGLLMETGPLPAPVGRTNRRSTASSSTDDKTESCRRRRMTMPLVYRMYESQSETLAGTIVGPDDDDFHPEEASKELRQALGGGIQSNDQTLIDVILSHNNFQRQKISHAYENMYGKYLADDIDEEAGGYFAETILGLFRKQKRQLLKVSQFSTHPTSPYLLGQTAVHVNFVVRSVVESLLRSQLQVIRDTYQTKYKVSLEKDLSVKIEGLFGRMLIQLLLRKEDHEEDDVDQELAQREAEALIKADCGLEEIGRNMELFNRLFNQSLRQVSLFIKFYDALALASKSSDERSRDFASSIRRSTSIHSDIRQMILLYVRIAQNMQLYFAEKLYEAISQTRPDYSSITRILVSRSEIDLFDICNEYKRKHGRHILLDLQMTCSGDFLRLLTKLINPRNGDIGRKRVNTPNFF